MQRRLAARGIVTIGQLQNLSERALAAEFGAIGRRLYRFARGEDDREVDPDAPTKSISAETTFDEDLSTKEALLAELWPLAQTVSRRLKRAELASQTVAIKLKTADFKTLTRHRRLSDPTQLAEVLYQAARPLVEQEADGREFRFLSASELRPWSKPIKPTHRTSSISAARDNGSGSSRSSIRSKQSSGLAFWPGAAGSSHQSPSDLH